MVVAAPPGADQARAAIRTINELRRQGATADIIAKGKVLRRYLTSLLPFEERKTGVVPYHPYVRQLWTSVLGTPYVELDEYNLDLWEFRRQLLRAAPSCHAEPQHLVVVQGQQLPVEFYSLLRLLSISATVFVDSTIVVDEDGSTLTELCRTLGVGTPVVLQEAARTTAPIHDFADYFQTGPPELVCRRPDRAGPRPMLFHHETTDDEAQFVLDYATSHPQASVGVLVPYGDMVTTFRSALALGLENKVQWHLAGAEIAPEQRVDCQRPGVKILTWTSAIGLEFDTVVLAGLHYAGYGPSSLQFQTTLQVLSTTARRELVLSYSGHGEPAVLDCLPRHLLDDRTPSATGAGPPPPLKPVRPPKAAVLEIVREYTNHGQLDNKATEKSAVDVARELLAVDRDDPGNRRRVLTAEEEVGLAQLMRGEHGDLMTELPRGFRSTLDPGDERAAAFDAMVTHNEGLVRSYLGNFRGTDLDDDDLYQHGVLGVMRAIEKFDATQGTKFSTYASHWIRQAQHRAVADEGAVIRIPVHMHDVIRKVRTTQDRLLGRYGRASVAAISDACGVEPNKVVDCLRLSAGLISLDARLADDAGLSFTDLVPAADGYLTNPDQVLDRQAGAQLVRQALNCLEDKEAEILRLRFGFDGSDGLTLDEIGEKFGVTRERIRQIETTAKKKLATELVGVGLVDIQVTDSEQSAPLPERPRTPHPPDGDVHVRRSSRDLASGSGLLREFGPRRPPPDLRNLLFQLVDLGLASQAHKIVIQSSQWNEVPWLALVHDGESIVDAVLRTLLAGSRNTHLPDPEARRAAVLAVGTALRLFDEIRVWNLRRDAQPSTFLVLTNSLRTDTWWLSSGTGSPPSTVMSSALNRRSSVVVFRAPRQGLRVPNLQVPLKALWSELGLVLGELLHANRVTLTINAQKVVRRDPFLWRNPRSQDLGTELVSAGGHSALVNPRVLPHPAALRDEDRYSAGEPAEWVATQGFYVRCARRYLSCGGWFGLEGLDSTPRTALARVAVEIEPTERPSWGLDHPGGVIAPPESLRPRLVALAALARRRSEHVLARRPVILPDKGEPT